MTDTSRRTKLLVDACVDAVAVICVTVLAAMRVIEGEIAVMTIGLVAGAWAGQRLRGGGGGPTPPTSGAGSHAGLVLAVAAGLLQTLRSASGHAVLWLSVAAGALASALG